MFTAVAHENSVWLPFQSFRLHAEALTSRERQVVLSMRPCKTICHVQVQLITFSQPHPQN